MSNRIDQRIVEMSFENAKFEKGILQSKNSLQTFSKALEQTNTLKSFANMEQSLAAIANSFTAMGQVGIGALRKIGEAAITAGTNVFKSLAIEPITQGFGEMELKMNSTQTIMASTGESLEVVNQRLQELNEYSDKTIYSFSDMTANIGKFTNAGVKLEDAVASIKGISNAAALSGANANEASRAMYNFAQALSSGSVKLLDWKSIELANMGTVEFKTQLLDAGVAAGTLTKQADGMYKVLSKDANGGTMDGVISATKNFNESLANQWMTTKVLTTTLGQYADETTDIGKRATLAATQVTTFSKLMDTLKESVGSGWSQTFEIIFGDFSEAKELWTGMNFTLGNTIAELSDARNTLLAGGLGSGWKQFMQEGISDTAAFGASLTMVAKDAGIDLDSMVKKTGSMEKALKGNWLTGDMLIKTVTKMSSSISKMSDEELRNAGYTEKTKTQLLSLRDALIAGRISADDFAKKMSSMSGRENIIQGLKNSVVALLTAIRPISKAFDQIFPPMTVKTLYEMTDNFKNLTEKLIISEETAKKIQRTFAGLFAVLDIGWQTVKFLGTALLDVAGAFLPLNGGVLEILASGGDFLVMLDKLVKQSGLFEYGLLGIKVAAVIVGNIISTMTDTFVDFVRVLLTTEHPIKYLGSVIQAVFSDILKGMKDSVSWISTKFFGSLSTIQKFFDTKLNFGDGTALTDILGSFKEFLDYVINGGADGIVSLGSALNSLDFSRIATFVTGGILLVFVNQLTRLTKVTGDLIETTNGFAAKLTKKLFGPITKFKDLALAVAVLSASLFMLSQVPFEKLKVGLAGLAGSMMIFTASYAAMQAITVMGAKKLNGVQAIESALNLTAMAGGLAILAIAISKISNIDRSKVWNSVAVVGAMMGVVVAYQALTVAISLIPGTRAANIGMSMMASGLLGLVTIVLLMDHISPEMITQSLGKLAGAMLMLAGIQSMFALAARISGGSKVAINVFGIAGGLLMMIGVVKLIGVLDSAEIMEGAKNIFLLGGILAAIQAMFSLASLINGGVKFKTNILSIQIGLSAMIVLAAIAGRMDQQQLQNGIVNLAKMGAIIAGLELITGASARLGGGYALQKILGSISLTMLAFTGIIAIVGHFKPETIDRGYATLIKMTGLIMAIELFTAIIGSIRGANRGVGILLGMTTTILTLTASLALLSMIDQEALTQASNSLGKAVMAVGVMGVSLAIMMNVLGKISSGMTVLKGLASMIIPGFAVLVTVFAATCLFLSAVNSYMPILQNISWDGMLKFTAGMMILSVFVGAFTALVSIPGLGSNGKNLLGLIPGLIAVGALVVATAGLFAMIGTVLPIVERISWDSFGKFIVGLGLIGTMVVGLAALSPLFMVLGTGFAPALVGVMASIAGVAMVVLAFAGLAAVMQALFGDNSDFLLDGIDKLILVAGGIGRFVGAIVGGFNSEVINGFGEGLAKFSESVSQIKAESFAGVESLARAMLLLTGAALIDGLARFVGLGANPGEVFGKQVSGLINAFAEIDIANVANFTAIIQSLEPALTGFSTLVQTANAIPNSGGVAGFFAGENDMDAFGRQVRGLIEAFATITVNEATITGYILQALAPTMDSFVALTVAAKKIPNSGGLAGLMAGENDMDMFASQIVGMVNAFKTISIAETLTVGQILNSLAPMLTNFGAFITVAKTIPNSGGLASLFAGGNDIDDFTKQLTNMIRGFGTIDSGQLQAANGNMLVMTTTMLPGLSKFVSMFNSLNATGGFAQIFKGQSSFTALANEIKSFVGILKHVDVSVVAPALVGLNQINESFKVVGADVIKSAVSSLQNNKSLFQTEIVKMLKESVQTVDKRRGDMSKSFTSMFDQVLKDSRKYVGQFNTLGQEIVRGLQKGISEGQKSANDAASKMASSVVTTTKERLKVNSPSKVFAEIGTWLPVGLGNGIIKNSKVATLASANMGGDVEEAIRNSLGVHSESKIFNDIGSWIPKSLGNGLDDSKKSLLERAKELGIDTSTFTTDGLLKGLKDEEGVVTSGIETLLDLLTGKTTAPSLFGDAKQTGSGAGGALGDGVADGVNSKKDKVKGAVEKVTKDAFQIFKEAIDKRKEYNLITTTEEIAAWQEFAKQYKIGTEMRMKADKELGRVRFEGSKTWIDKEKYYKRLSLEEELAAWTRVQSRYKEGHEYRLQAEREIFRLKEEIWQEEYNHALEVIDDEKYYGKLKLNEELAMMRQVRAMTKEDTEERKKSDREIFSLEKEINEKNLAYMEKLKQVEKDRNEARKKATDEYYEQEKEVNEKLIQDTTRLRQEYDSAVESRAKSLYSAYGIFDKVETPEAIDGTVLVQNLEDQTKAFENWQQNIATLSAKGVDEGLIKELREMGPKATAQIAALNTLSSAELSKYVSLWQKKSQEAKEQAILELQSLKIATENEIMQITIAANAKLQEYKIAWVNALAEIDINTKKQLDAIQKEWVDSIGAMTDTGVTLIQQFRKDWYNEIDGMISDTKSQLAELQNAINNADLTIPSGGGGGSGSGGGTGLYDKADTGSIGGNVVAGLASGMLSNTSMVVSAAESLGRQVHDTMTSFWGIASPAKKTIETGKYIVMGLAEGLYQFSNLATNAAGGLGVKTVDAMSASMSTIPELFESGVDEITITPVVDLSNVKAGIRDVNKMFGDVSGLDLSTTLGLLPTTIVPPIKDIKESTSVDMSKQSQPVKMEYNQYNYSPKALSRIEIYRQTKNQLATLKG